jgi:hypothetical protein
MTYLGFEPGTFEYQVGNAIPTEPMRSSMQWLYDKLCNRGEFERK